MKPGSNGAMPPAPPVPAPPTPTDVDDVAEDALVATDAPPPLELPAVALPPPPPEADPP
ncbi:hypothetical protein SCE1572_29055 [Sorangium cellulosum So0157-2]|uniref:Uncharacterized protein n=2 Tax=Sorangium cellulosum TaxID=56 RepID=S4XY73_SORCE|nr:hypothetical protein SCE1572_29055 [Sorangium cellulosum So0157-2]